VPPQDRFVEPLNEHIQPNVAAIEHHASMSDPRSWDARRSEEFSADQFRHERRILKSRCLMSWKQLWFELKGRLGIVNITGTGEELVRRGGIPDG
jgi:hypothetical protein